MPCAAHGKLLFVLTETMVITVKEEQLCLWFCTLFPVMKMGNEEVLQLFAWMLHLDFLLNVLLVTPMGHHFYY